MSAKCPWTVSSDIQFSRCSRYIWRILDPSTLKLFIDPCCKSATGSILDGQVQHGMHTPQLVHIKLTISRHAIALLDLNSLQPLLFTESMYQPGTFPSSTPVQFYWFFQPSELTNIKLAPNLLPQLTYFSVAPTSISIINTQEIHIEDLQHHETIALIFLHSFLSSMYPTKQNTRPNQPTIASSRRALEFCTAASTYPMQPQKPSG